MQPDEVRLRILECVINQATRVGLFEPAVLIETCTKLENYVLDSKPVGELPTPASRKTLHRPEKTTGRQSD